MNKEEYIKALDKVYNEEEAPFPRRAAYDDVRQFIEERFEETEITERKEVMFKIFHCLKCNEEFFEITHDYNYCPYCGRRIFSYKKEQ